MSAAVQGGCICKAVRYELLEDPKATWICHCLDCRRCSGSLFMANSYVKSESLRITAGQEQLTVFYDKNSTQTFEAYFCSVCHTLIYTDSEDMRNDHAFVMPSGTLDDPSSWKPQMEFWCKRRAEWMPSFGTPANKMFSENPN